MVKVVVIATAMSCSLILIILDISKSLVHKRIIEKELEGFGMRLNKTPPNIIFKKKDKGGIHINVAPGYELVETDEETVESILKEYRHLNCSLHIRCNATADDVIDILVGNRKYVAALYVMNKIDVISLEELEVVSQIPYHVPISGKDRWNIDGLVESIWDSMDLTRVYTKPKGCMPDFDEPVMLSKSRRTIENFINKIHKTLLTQFKHALVWGTSVKYYPQVCGLDHVLEDEDVVQIVKKVA